VVAFGALGCGSSSSSTTITLVISPTQASVITNTTSQFASLVNGTTDTAVTWTVTCATVTNATVTNCGTIDANGLYTAPATVPTATIAGVVTAEPTLTITATAHADTTKTATATLTIITGISISITPANAFIGTGEHFTFTATVSNPGCNTTSNPTCLNVTWSVPTTTTGLGSIDTINPADPTLARTGLYHAPTTAPSPSTVTITATSVADTTITATATVTIQTAGDPAVSSVSPKNAALGSLFQDIYVTGTNFLSTSIVYLNGSPIDPAKVADISSSVIRARISPDILSSLPPLGVLAVAVSQQVGTAQTCADPSQCQIVINSVHPAIVGPSPDSITQGNAGVLSFNVNGGFFGTATNPSVSATFDGQLRVAQVTGNTTRQISVSIGGPATANGAPNPQDFSQAGLHQVTLRSNGDPTKFAATNIAVQPDVNANPPTQVGTAITVGTTPSDVAINPATGMAVVANTGSNDVTLIDATATNPTAPLLASLCTGALGTASAPCSVVTGPKSVAVAHLINPTKNIALVANATAKTISEIDLDSRSVIWVSQTLQNSPVAVGINPVTGRALVGISTQPYGLLIDLTSQASPVILGPVSISTGPNSHIAVEPHLNWALATPGTLGSVGIVDLNRQTTNNITAISRTTNVVTVTVQGSTTAVPQSPLSVVAGDAVQIQGVSVSGDTSFNGIYVVSAVGPGSAFSYTQTGATLKDVTSTSTTGTVNYSEPVATLALPTGVQGIAINPETQIAIFADPTASGVISFFNLIDQSVSSLTLEPGAAAAAYNQLTNTAYVVNTNNSTLSVIDPTTPKRLLLPGASTTKATGTSPVAVAVDPASNRLVVVNQGDKTVSVYSLGDSSTVRPMAITETNPKIFFANSTLTSPPSPSAITLTVIGSGFTCTSGTTTLKIRLDGIQLPASCNTADKNRVLTATVTSLTAAHRYALDVFDPATSIVTNASDFTVEQQIDVRGCSATPFPAGVSVDPQQNIAAVTLAGCNAVALINLSNGTGQTALVGSNPLGVAVLPRLHLAVVANNGSNSASVVDELSGNVTLSPSTDSGSVGVAADQDTGEAAVANSVANTATVINVTGGGTTSIATGARPIAVGFDYLNHQIAVAATTSNAIDIANASGGTVSQTFAVSVPTSVVYDPVTGDLGNDCGSVTNVVGCFLVNSSTGNNLSVIDPTNGQQSAFRIGINPTALAYNYLTSTLISTNTLSHTVTVVDFLDKRIRAVLTLPPAPANSTLALTGALQFAVDIQPLTNLAVIADTANGRVLLIPVPR
jgi:DNA-binding beta-propeller fold protein YncE